MGGLRRAPSRRAVAKRLCLEGSLFYDRIAVFALDPQPISSAKYLHGVVERVVASRAKSQRPPRVGSAECVFRATAFDDHEPSALREGVARTATRRSRPTSVFRIMVLPCGAPGIPTSRLGLVIVVQEVLQVGITEVGRIDPHCDANRNAIGVGSFADPHADNEGETNRKYALDNLSPSGCTKFTATHEIRVSTVLVGPQRRTPGRQECLPVHAFDFGSC